ncbi:MAG: 50S ribosomal protein L17 [Bacteroidota bacterium]
MRHGKKFNHLGRTASHRKALLARQATSLLLHKRLITTVAKAKMLRKFVEPIITKARRQDTTHARRMVFAHFQDKAPVKALFNEIVHEIGDRPGGYTRIIRISGRRLGDNAELCLIELVDYNELYTKMPKAKGQDMAHDMEGNVVG